MSYCLHCSDCMPLPVHH